MSTVEEFIDIYNLAGSNKIKELFLQLHLTRKNEKFIGMYDKHVQFFIKRILDFVFVSIGLILISPILAMIVLLIKIDSKGSVLFSQKRIGANGKEFNMYKFRSMVADADKKKKQLMQFNETNGHMFKMYNDPRITRVGAFLRKYSLDELPQLINVLKGEMSLVGYRPPLAEEVKGYEQHHYLRFLSMPGLTGPWQVGGRSSIKDFDEVVKLEYDYAKDWNLLKDLKILFKTIPVVLFGKDAA